MKAFILIGFLALSLNLNAQDYPININEKGEIRVDVALNGFKPESFIFDTGFGLTSLSENYLKILTGEKISSGIVTHFDNYGNRFDYPLYTLESISIGETELAKDIKVSTIANLEKQGISGILSLHSFGSTGFVLDLSENLISFPSKNEQKEIRNSALEIPIQLDQRSDISLKLILQFCINDNVINTVFDSRHGYSEMLVNNYYTRVMEDINIYKEEEFTTSNGQTLTDKHSKVSGKGLCDIGQITEIEKPNVIFREALIHQGLIGLEFLKGQRIFFDMAEKRLFVLN